MLPEVRKALLASLWYLNNSNQLLDVTLREALGIGANEQISPELREERVSAAADVATDSAYLEAQLAELERTTYSTRYEGEFIKIRDGLVSPRDVVWWRSEGGPYTIRLSDLEDIAKAKEYPELYQLTEPEYTIQYKD